ncbi:MAG: hypothetical protein V4662_18515 [Verrucomicrobiota bacterium]
MAYQVKESLTAKPRTYALEGIHSDYKQKLLAGTALVCEERQDFWYSVAELVGDAPTARFSFVCPKCKGMVPARQIDVGLETKCPRCQNLTQVPDVKARQNSLLDRHLLKEANQTVFAGAVIFLVGAGATVAGYLDAISRNGTSFYVLWGLAVIGAGMMITGFGRRSIYFKKYPKDGKRG